MITILLCRLLNELMILMTIVSLANMATQVMWYQQFHLLFINFIIGILEAFILVKWFRGHKYGSFPLLIAANYFSSFVGFFLIVNNFLRSPWYKVWRPTVENYQVWFIVTVGICFILTVILEWPFVFAAVKGGKGRVLRSVKACVVVQTISYITCIGLPYFLYGNVRIRSEVEVVSSADFVANDLPFWVYYIESVDGEIWRMRPDGSGQERFLETHLLNRRARNENTRLYLEPIGDNPPADFLCPLSSSLDSKIVIMKFAGQESVFRGNEGYPTRDTMNISYAADLRGVPSDEQAQGERWYGKMDDYNGVEFQLRKEGEVPSAWYSSDDDIQLSFTTGLGSWPGRNISILPGDIAIFELGGQICVLDLNARKLALLCLGYGPVVARDREDVVSEDGK